MSKWLQLRLATPRHVRADVTHHAHTRTRTDLGLFFTLLLGRQLLRTGQVVDGDGQKDVQQRVCRARVVKDNNQHSANRQPTKTSLYARALAPTVRVQKSTLLFNHNGTITMFHVPSHFCKSKKHQSSTSSKLISQCCFYQATPPPPAFLRFCCRQGYSYRRAPGWWSRSSRWRRRCGCRHVTWCRCTSPRSSPRQSESNVATHTHTRTYRDVRILTKAHTYERNGHVDVKNGF